MSIELNIANINSWFTIKSRPIVIAGPCSAESEEQVMEVANELAASNKVSLFRAGVWKPRTRPGAFEGKNKEALVWLNKVKKETGLPVTVEVANPKHVEEALKYEMDVLWIGARTTVNPFYVQEIAEALKGVDIPVLVKNPIHPELQLWIGALERFNKVGITKLAAIHRGFYSFGKSEYRNIPQWEIPIALKVECPDLLVICDPSHIAGRADMIEEVAQKAIDLNMDGLMIETHPNPSLALSDAKQQITPQRLIEILNNLKIRETHSANIEFENLLEQLRHSINEIDYELLRILEQRMAVVEKIGMYKYENNVAVFQLDRWAEILKTRKAKGYKLGLSDEFIQAIFQLIHSESIRIQTEISKENKKSSS
ncbi:MAG: chorismate mutase [Bacteroidia bacterium]